MPSFISSRPHQIIPGIFVLDVYYRTLKAAPPKKHQGGIVLSFWELLLPLKVPFSSWLYWHRVGGHGQLRSCIIVWSDLGIVVLRKCAPLFNLQAGWGYVC